MSLWNDFVTAALLGTERGTPPQLPPALAALSEPLAASGREEGFLAAAGALALWRRAGTVLPTTEERPAPADPESQPMLGGASIGHLRAMLSGRAATILPEWLRRVVELGRRLPPELLPALFDRAQRVAELRPLVIAAGGERARWLVAQNREWRKVDVADDPELWETGTRDQRVAIASRLRATAPDEAREKIEEVWKGEPAETRAALLGALQGGLSVADEPFLELALDDRSKEVRRAAVELLVQLPESALVGRMKERLEPLLLFKSKLVRKSIEVVLPGDPDAAAVRDGLDPKAIGTNRNFGEKALLLIHMLSTVPPSYWSEKFGESPEAILKAAGKNEFSTALATGWAWAAFRHNDPLWAEALLDCSIDVSEEFYGYGSLFTILPEPLRAERIAARLRQHRSGKEDDAHDLRVTAQYLDTFSGFMPASLGRDLLAALRKVASDAKPWYLSWFEELLLKRLPPELLSEAIEGWPPENTGATSLAQSLTFRRDALNALQP